MFTDQQRTTGFLRNSEPATEHACLDEFPPSYGEACTNQFLPSKRTDLERALKACTWRELQKPTTAFAGSGTGAYKEEEQSE